MAFPKARGRQARMMELTGWSKASCSQLYNNTQDYSPKIVNEAAKALNVEPYELLMHPDKAMKIRRYISSAEDIAKLVHSEDPKPASSSTIALDREIPKTGTDGE